MVGDNLPKGWKWVSLDDVRHPDKRAIVSGPFGSNIGSRFFVSSGVPVIRGNNLTTEMTRYIDDGYVFLTEEKAKEFKNCEAYPNDLIFTAAGTLGQVGILPPDAKFPRYIISNKQMRVRVDENVILPLYAYYWLASPEMVDYIIQRNTGSSVPLINLTVLRHLPIPLAPIPEQREIVRILSALDDKIELNRRMNHTLEEMAQAIFKSWFVDFDPVIAKAEGRQPFGMNDETAALFPAEFIESGDDDFPLMPKDWSLSSLAEIAHYENGLALQKYRPEDSEFLPVIKIRELRQGFADASSEKASPNIKASCIIDDGDMIFSWSGSLMIDLWCGGRGALNQHLFRVTSDKFPQWYYYFWTNYHLPDFQDIAEGKATTMGHIQRHHLASAGVIVPPDDVLAKADKVIQPMIDLIIKNRVHSNTLATIRDLLLPRLLSGEIRVKGGNGNG